MIARLSLGLVLTCLVACGETATADQPAPEITDVPTAVTVGNITCHSCVDTVEQLLGERAGVRIGYIDLTDQQLTLHVDAGVDLGPIRQTLDSKDHPVGAARVDSATQGDSAERGHEEREGTKVTK